MMAQPRLSTVTVLDSLWWAATYIGTGPIGLGDPGMSSHCLLVVPVRAVRTVCSLFCLDRDWYLPLLLVVDCVPNGRMFMIYNAVCVTHFG